MAEPFSFKNSVWQTPLLPIIPKEIEGVKESSICISNRKKGEWQFLFSEIADIPSPFSKTQDYNFSYIPDNAWQEVIVPASLTMQGFDIENNKEYYYKTMIKIPHDYKGKRIFLRFEGVYSNARIWINNQYICSHIGGFTPFDCDITRFGNTEEITIIVGIADIEGTTKGIWNPEGATLGDCSYGSFYGHNNLCGILRDVTLFVLNNKFIGRLHTETILSDTKAQLNAALGIYYPKNTKNEHINIKMELYDKEGLQKAVLLENITDYYKITNMTFPDTDMNPDNGWREKHKKSYENDTQNEKRFIHTLAEESSIYDSYDRYGLKLNMIIENPILWNAENPYLYTLNISLLENNTELQKDTILFGFRSIGYGGKDGGDKNKLYINGSEIKLRGVCRHDISYQYGRSLSKEEELSEILAYKRNNINFIRTSHYPVSENMLSLCDQYGIYVEQENAACFKGANGVDIYCAPQDFVNGFTEMVEYSRNHASIIIWSLANESGFDETYAFRKEYHYIKEADPTRPVIFSYPETVNSTPRPYDIFSMHYQEVTSDLGLPDIPKLHDEFAHVPCYNLEDLKLDSNLRNVWGESIKRGWDNIFNTDGALGCAIWGGIDDVFLLPEGVKKRHQCHSDGKAAGYGEWGAILDIYKREKPEAYLTKKAFSPIYLDTSKSIIYNDKAVLCLKNRFDHTDLKDIKMICSDEKGNILYTGKLEVSILPHKTGYVSIPISSPYKRIKVEFYKDNILIENEIIETAVDKMTAEEAPLLQLTCEETCDFIKYRSTELSLSVNKQDGTIKLYDTVGEKIIDNAEIFRKGIPELKQLNAEVSYQFINRRAQIIVKRIYDKSFTSEIQIIFSGAAIQIKNIVTSESTDFHKLEKIGLKLKLCKQVEAVSWKKKGLYSIYPEHHIGRNIGTAYAIRKSIQTTPYHYGEKPEWNWEQDMENPFMFTEDENKSCAVTNDFKTTRDNIRQYNIALAGGSQIHITPLSENISAFVKKEEDNDWLLLSKGNYYPSLSWGNYCGEKLDADCFEIAFIITTKREMENKH